MVEKIFGLVFLVAAIFFAWKFTSMPANNSSHGKKASTSSHQSGKSPSKGPNDETENSDSPIIADIKDLLDQQVELVGLSENIQRISFKTHLENKNLNMAIAKSLQKVSSQKENAPYLLEAEVFDTSGPESDPKDKKKKSQDGAELPNTVIFQFSVYDIRTQNKVGEFGATYELAKVAPELANQDSQNSDKKKPDETKASSGSK